MSKLTTVDARNRAGATSCPGSNSLDYSLDSTAFCPGFGRNAPRENEVFRCVGGSLCGRPPRTAFRRQIACSGSPTVVLEIFTRFCGGQGRRARRQPRNYEHTWIIWQPPGCAREISSRDLSNLEIQ